MSSINKLKIYSASSLISEDIQIGPTLSIGCSGWIVRILLIRAEDGLRFSIQIKKPRDYATTHSSLILQKWIPPFITDSSIVWLEIEIR